MEHLGILLASIHGYTSTFAHNGHYISQRLQIDGILVSVRATYLSGSNRSQTLDFSYSVELPSHKANAQRLDEFSYISAYVTLTSTGLALATLLANARDRMCDLFRTEWRQS